uniref:Disease resistance N-terminal domain-containing protein n=1 Tax=Aegilops tauschii TaxID=37682 RepID=R7W356_AEGTA
MEGILVSTATGVMNSLLTKFTELMSEEYKPPKAVKIKIGSLKSELSSINAFLKKLADREDLDGQTKEWRDQPFLGNQRQPLTLDRMPPLYAEATDIVGSDAKIDELTELATDQEGKQLKVVSIIGYGGSGKTGTCGLGIQKP